MAGSVHNGLRVDNQRIYFINRHRLSFAWFLLVLMFLPISVTIGGQGISANYLFVVLLLIGSVRNPDKWNAVVVLYILFCIVSYIIGVFLFSRFDADFLLRQSISFYIFILPILLLFIRIPYSIDDICLAAFVVSCIYSAYTLSFVLIHGMLPISDTFGARAYLMNHIPEYPQRFIIIVLFSVFYGISRIKNNIWYIPAVLLLLFSVYISFTRAAWSGLGVGFLAYSTSVLLQMVRNSKVRLNFVHFLKWFGLIIISASIVTIILEVSPIMIEGITLHLNRLVDAFTGFIHDPQSFNPQGSEGIRMQIWHHVVNIVMSYNPVSGTGFAGIHQFLGADWGSTHSQYMDIFLRTGFVGLGFYLFFWLKALRHYVAMPGVFAGLIALFAFGFSQETTKLSYGSLLFFLLLNKVYFDNKKNSDPMGLALLSISR